MSYYTQRQWDRVVGIGKVPPEYQDPREKETENFRPYHPVGLVRFGETTSDVIVDIEKCFYDDPTSWSDRAISIRFYDDPTSWSDRAKSILYK